LREVVRGPLRRLAALALNLPPEARVWAESEWPVQNELLALIAGEINHGWRQLAVLQGVREHELPPPLTIARPWDPPPEAPSTGLDFDAIRAFFG
jgi:hypothetical protein